MLRQVFGYATLKSANIRGRVLGHETDTVPDYLDNYAVVEESGKLPNLERKVGGLVRGVRFPASLDDIDKLDEWESEYERIPVSLRSGVRAWAYMVKPRGKASSEV